MGEMAIVEQYPMKLKKELLDLGAIEIDKTLETLLDGINEPMKELEFINEEGISRTFKLNRKEGILEGRGIKGFFNRYDSENIFVEPIDKGIFKLHESKRIKKTIFEELNINPQNTERMKEILNAAANMKTYDEKWFQLHKLMRDFLFDTDEGKLLCLTQQGIMVSQFNGGMRRKEKEQQIMMFRESAQVLVSTEVGGEGRNLQFCNGMVNYDLPWNPMAIEQRIGRIHRVGQERDVYVFNLAASGTVEYYILELLDKKINMFELVVGELDMILGDIEEEEQFPEMIMGAWVNSNDLSDMEKQIDIIGERLLEGKRQCVKMKDLDEKLFGDSFKARKQEV